MATSVESQITANGDRVPVQDRKHSIADAFASEASRTIDTQADSSPYDDARKGDSAGMSESAVKSFKDQQYAPTVTANAVKAPSIHEALDFGRLGSLDDATMKDFGFGPDNPSQDLTDRITKAPMQLEQVVLYSKLMEDRVLALEREVSSLRERKVHDSGTPIDPAAKDSHDAGTSEKDSVPTSKLVEKEPLQSLEKYRLLPAIARLTETDYIKVHRQSEAEHDERKHTIDVLTAKPSSENASLSTLAATKTSPKGGQNSDACTTNEVPSTSNEPLVGVSDQMVARPFRIRINSERLIRELFKVIGQPAPPESTTFLPPFRVFTLFHKRLRDHTQILENARHEARLAIGIEAMDRRGEGVDPALLAPWEPVDSEEDILGESGLDGSKIFNVMEGCQVSRNRAVKALRSNYYESTSIEVLKREMTPVEEQRMRLGLSELLLQDWKVLIGLLDNDLEPLLGVCSQIQDGTLSAIRFEDLSHLYHPGDTVLSTENRRLQAYEVLGVTGGRELFLDSAPTDLKDDNDGSSPTRGLKKYSPFTVDYRYFDFDGSRYVFISKSISVARYAGAKIVTSLPIYPIKFHREAGLSVVMELKNRGNKFAQYCSKAFNPHKQYIGRTLDETPEEVDSQVIVDCEMAAIVQPNQRPDKAEWMPTEGSLQLTTPDDRELFYEIAPRLCTPGCTTCLQSSKKNFDDRKLSTQESAAFLQSLTYSDESSSGVAEIEEKNWIFLPQRIFGFVLRSRKWGMSLRYQASNSTLIDCAARLDVNKIKELTKEASGFEKLVLPEDYANIIQALVKEKLGLESTSKEDSRAHDTFDLVRGKGKGLIILLHGPPGVGKTSTAECVAEYAGRPLYPITCGDIGENAKELEENLDRCFHQAHRWGCILLLDEADVFLARRNKTDLKRNALVSGDTLLSPESTSSNIPAVFLRVLEYYAGILFLTTNRVGAFDDAFKSRIHVKLYYPTLDEDSTVKIWKNHLENSDELKALEVDHEGILKFARKHYREPRYRSGGEVWNGRQIRNAFQTATALARWEARPDAQGNAKNPSLKKSHFKQVSKTSADFDAYLHVTHGLDEDDRAANVDERTAVWKDPNKSRKRSRDTQKKSQRRSEVYEVAKSSKSKSKKLPKPENKQTTAEENSTSE